MRSKLFFFLLGLLLWLGFGAIIGGFSAVILSYTWVMQVVIYGAIAGILAGIVIGAAAILTSTWVRSHAVMPWMLIGSIVGASVGFKSIVIWGGYPQGSQADLSFIALAPMGLAIGALSGSLIGAVIRKYRQLHRQF